MMKCTGTLSFNVKVERGAERSDCKKCHRLEACNIYLQCERAQHTIGCYDADSVGEDGSFFPPFFFGPAAFAFLHLRRNFSASVEDKLTQPKCVQS